MTDLELAICESESNGDIDTDTRDIMLNILKSNAYIEESSDDEDNEDKKPPLSTLKKMSENMHSMEYLRKAADEANVLLNNINKAEEDGKISKNQKEKLINKLNEKLSFL